MLFHVKGENITTECVDSNDINIDDKDNDDDGDDDDDDKDNGDKDDDVVHVESDSPLSTEISESAVADAINFVQLCCQQTAFMAGRDYIQEEIQIVNASM